jgi:CBS domain-containing protein
MFVSKLLSQAHAIPVMIMGDAPILQAATLLRGGADLVMVRDSAGALAGVITRTDIVRQMSGCRGGACAATASSVMTRDVVLCRPDELLHDVWLRMKEHRIKSIPVTRDLRPQGVLSARDVLEVLLAESENEEAMLRDYFECIGYNN